MEKTKLGVPVYFLGAAFYLLCLFGGYIPAILVGGYILIRETEENVRTAAVTGFAVLLAFSLLNIVFGFFPDLVETVQQTLNSTGLIISLQGAYDTMKGLQDFVSFLGDALLVVLAVFMLIKKPLNVPFLKKIAN